MSEKNAHINNNPDRQEIDRNLSNTFGRVNPFVTPQGYFENLPQQIMKRIRKEEAGKKNSGLNVLFKPYSIAAISLAAAALLFIAYVLFIPGDEEKAERISAISLDELLEYNPEYITDMDEWLLIETLYADNETEAYPDDYDQSLDFDSTITNDDILNYMIENDLSETFYENL
ncbi:MAG: hypothetical protein KDC05_12350 [Bacteroidales bacterium]|nr:hypothetical protein [Bacteroidales bacterium]